MLNLQLKNCEGIGGNLKKNVRTFCYEFLELLSLNSLLYCHYIGQLVKDNLGVFFYYGNLMLRKIW